jgi:hypothetical protein
VGRCEEHLRWVQGGAHLPEEESRELNPGLFLPPLVVLGLALLHLRPWLRRWLAPWLLWLSWRLFRLW